MNKPIRKIKCEHCTHKYEKQFQIQNTDQLLVLMQIYLSEWSHRDSMLWKQVSTYFISTLVVMILPFINLWELNLGEAIPNWLFPTVGLCMSIAFFIIGKGYAVRLTAIGKTYENILRKLPDNFQRIQLKEINPHSLANMRMAYFIVYLMTGLLTLLGIVLLTISIGT